MNAQSQTHPECPSALPTPTATAPPATSAQAPSNEPIDAPILCPHCRRTASNGIKCKGICVADSDY